MERAESREQGTKRNSDEERKERDVQGGGRRGPTAAIL